ncbi:polysaccharide pyruvyl transferase family protein [Pseudarthrobacter enclensis]|uniref:polysaccharide pyruvyl transferase family protein n=1 Tax=Pseudarthrobacter enclensis TaxID=993070 RepID=UPI0036B2B8EA
MLGPELVKSVLAEMCPQSSDAALAPSRSPGNGRLLSVGSIMHYAHDGDIIWGTGVNGKVPGSQHGFESIDVRAVRGPLTARWLTQHKNVEVPEIYGDPGLLVRRYYPALKSQEKSRKTLIIPNLNEMHKFRSHPDFVNPTAPLGKVLRQIAASEFVIGSSLHSIIVADSLGVPSALLKSDAEPLFKYEDYFRGTGRVDFEVFSDLDAAARAAGRIAREQSESDPLKNWNESALVQAFPVDLWQSQD